MVLTTIASGVLMFVVGIVGLLPLMLVIFEILFLRQSLTPFRGEWMPKCYRPVVGYLALALQYSSFYTSVGMTINRFFTIMYPLKCRKWFRPKAIIVMISICWLFAWAHNLIYLIPGCEFTFDFTIIRFVFSEERCADNLSLYQDLIYNIVLSILVTTIDIFSLAKLRRMARRTAHVSIKTRREKPWFLQATINSALYLLMLVCFHTSDFFDGTNIRFFLAVISWELYLSSAPYCIIILQKEFQTPFRNVWKRAVHRKEISILHVSTELKWKSHSRPIA
ncbi:hypothetical protein RB195_003703 [Necator americanus]|uniref:G-protein coupled receptors family 1 profile domain-containing protein n=1 Tax=Necator americanus TaxID=51031 RepID=A0ABR1DPR7_NECAM